MATIKPKGVRLEGVTVRRVSGHNLRFLKNMGIGIGAIVEVKRRGEVIPHIERTLTKAKKVADPSDAGFEWKWSPTKVDAILTGTNDEDLDRIRILRLTSFFTNVGIDQVRTSAVSKMVEGGFNTISKILRMTPAQMEQTGIGPNLSSKLHGLIHAKTAGIPIHVLMNASQMWGNGLGQRRFEPLAKKFGPKLLDWPEQLSQKTMIARVSELPGFSTITATQFATGLPKFVKWLAATKLVPAWPSRKKPVQTSGKFSGQAVCFTGFRSKEVEAEITRQGGTIVAGVNSKTTLLVVKSLTDSSIKITNAKNLGIKIVDEARLRRML